MKPVVDDSVAGATAASAFLFAYRLCAAFILVGMYVKVGDLRQLFSDAAAAPIFSHSLLPSPLLSAGVVKVVWILPALAIPLLALPQRWARIAFAVVLLAVSIALAWNFNTYNDATWVTSAWSSAFLLWLGLKPERSLGPDTGRMEVLIVAQAVLALIFLGGFVGKLTGGYFDGTVLKELYLERKDWLFWPLLRTTLSADAQLTFMRGFSWLTLALEGAMALCLFFPPRVFFVTALLACLGIPLVSHWMLASVLAPPLGVLVAAAVVWWKVDRA